MTYQDSGIVAATQDDSTSDAPTGQGLALPPNLGDMVAGRTRAIELWLDSYDTFHRNMDAAAAASIGGRIGMSAPSDDRYSGINVTRLFLATGETERYDRGVNRRIKSNARADLLKAITTEVDRRCWDHMMVKLGFDQLLDRQAREEFQASLKTEPPEFSVENCKATFTTIWGSRREMYLRGIANVFMKMDRRFRSHDAFAIGNRLIIERAMNADSWGGWSDCNRRDTLHDVERIFRELDGAGTIAMGGKGGIVAEVEAAKRAGGLPSLVQGDYFRVRVFQNGNLHLWFERKDLLAQVNKLLLEYYNPVEGDVGEGPSYEAGPLYHATPAKNFGAFNSSEAVVEFAMNDVYLKPGMRVLEPSAGTGMFVKAALEKGADVTCIEIQPGLAHELRVVHWFSDVRTADFLEMKPDADDLFDVILMNPPFDRGRDCDHVRHAFGFLKPGGKLVAVMSARAEFGTDARHKALHDLIAAERDRYYGREWRDLPEGSFLHAGTNVNTVVLTVTKRKAS
ncbi:DUF4942 domain-containing protein [Sphingomonas sp. HMP6]|uniref:DUF4942 domain-containing protein n=1 Tax=Sphingomonas sp. HMP6 TaxID=1517551 RepID=UPI0015967027|nr:DUF4942 domain-containing protein [Sphingomonas sp. HMP6]BCA57704.1 hypothetical protein HMP06_0473 [Sphingomonas sp. HMP6]